MSGLVFRCGETIQNDDCSLYGRLLPNGTNNIPVPQLA